MKARMLAGAALIALVSGRAGAQTAIEEAAAPTAGAAAAPGGGNPTAPQANPFIADIIVTAQRRAEAIQDVPVAISVFESTDRDRRGLRSIQDFANFTPGLTFSSSLDRLSLRGIGRLTNTIGSDPGVAIYNDGFYTSSNAEASKTPMFVDRVEFLRGPQGTLYGRNSVGGAINVISKRPTSDLTAEWRFSVDNLQMVSEGYIAGPVAGGLSARLSAQLGRAMDARFENIARTPNSRDEGFTNRFFVEAQLQYDFSDTTQLWLKYSHAEWNDSNPVGNQVSPYVTDDIDGATNNSLTPAAAFGYPVLNPGVTDARRINSNTRNRSLLSDNHTFVANFTADLGNVGLKYVGGYSQYSYQALSDLDYTANELVTTSFGSAPIAALAPFGLANAFRTYSYNPTYVQDYGEQKKYFTNELTLSNATSGRFNWIVGAFQFYEEFFQPVTWFVDGANTDTLSQRIAAPICVAPVSFAVVPDCPTNPRRAFYDGSGDLRTEGYAGFGQVDYELVDGLKATAGLRYSWDKKRGDESYRVVQWQPASASVYCTLTPGANATVIGFGGCGAATAAQDLTRFLLNQPGVGAATRRLEDSWDGFSWRLGLDWKPDDNTLVFGSYSRGLKAGGFNLGSYADAPVVDKETVDAFELGLKSRPLAPLMLNITGFFYDYKNAQIPIVVVRPGSTLTTTNFFNIDRSRSWGIEVESAWNVTDALELTANYSFNDTEIRRAPRLFDDEGVPGNVLEDITGNRLPAASRHKLAVSALYDIPVAANDHVFLAASYAYRSDAYYSVFQNPINRAPGWDQVDARITYARPDDGMTLILYARNLFDTLGYDGAFSTNAGTIYRQVFSYTLPRQIGVEAQFKF
ncbi:TonB-dependent receptor [Sphingomonas jeddahensis]|uniref:Ferrichrome-iron receptor n=1 Tax=Sphingomonas jeddahensis TaxID=1915074 RepID=A0A1V2ETQ0_9SPHN|nr:TonB-dependent receptor [Sphingomonas jeddahensis]ONF96062.1 Ferrichrome-iron receptor precursor [Sphingomonas jeddahensis]